MDKKHLLVIVDDLSRPTFEANQHLLPGVLPLCVDVHDRDQIDEAARSADIVLLFSWQPTKEVFKQVLAANPNIEWVHSWWAGVDSLLFPELKSYPTVLTNGRGNFAPALGEFVIASCLYFAKDFPRLLNNQRAARWERFEGELLSGKTIGIFGYGEIGKAVASRAKALGMTVIGVKRRPGSTAIDPFADTILGSDGLIQMCRRSDFVVCSAPLTKDTTGRIDRSVLNEMKSSAVFINVGRGPVVVERDLVYALSSGKIRAAALDVFEKEPLDSSSPLWQMENVLVSAHCADRYPGWVESCFDFYARNLSAFLSGEELANRVDIQEGY